MPVEAREFGEVIEVTGKVARVKVRPIDEAKCAGCTVCTSAGETLDGQILAKIRTDEPVAKGDRVKLVFESSAASTLAFLSLTVPVIGLVFAQAVGAWLFPESTTGTQGLLGGLIAFGALVPVPLIVRRMLGSSAITCFIDGRDTAPCE
jgi:positive regulator of sigma E activity